MSGLHSPGPWWFGVCAWDGEADESSPCVKPPEFRANGYGGNPFIYAANGHEVVGCDEYDVFGDWDAPEGSREANIRLLLAAPELLEALAGCVEHMEHSTPQGRAAWVNARAAIAKATGAAP